MHVLHWFRFLALLSSGIPAAAQSHIGPLRSNINLTYIGSPAKGSDRPGFGPAGHGAPALLVDLPTGTPTSGTAVRPPAAHNADVFNVMDYGAACNSNGQDGGTDDSAAINAAFAAGRASGKPFTVESPGNATCFIAHSINATNLSGNVAPNGTGYGTTIRLRLDCATHGTPCVDALQSRWVNWDELYIFGETRNAPNVGIQIGLATAQDTAAHDYFAHPYVMGDFSFAAFYNVGSEVLSVIDPYFENTASGGRALVQDGYNHFKVTSAFVPATLAADTAISFNENTFIGGTYGAQDIAPIWFGNAQRHKIIGGYCLNGRGHAIDLYFEGGQLLSQLDVDCHVEVRPNVTDVFWLSGPNPSVYLRGLHWRDHSPWVTNSVLKIDPASAIKSAAISDLDVNIGGPNPDSVKLVVFDDPALWTRVAGHFQLPAASMYNAPSGTIDGNPITTGSVCIAYRCTQLVPTPVLNRNPDFVLDQPNEGSSADLGASGQFLLDGWHGFTNGGSGRISTQRYASAPPPGFSHAWLINTLGTFAPAPNAYAKAQTAIEGADFEPLQWGTPHPQPLSVDVCLQASNPGTYTAFLQNGANNLTYLLDFAVSAANAWQCFHKVVAGPTSGSWSDEPNLAGLYFGWNFYAGASLQAPPGVWTAGNYASDSNTTQLVRSGMTLKIAALHIYPGQIALPYQPRRFAEELALDQRFARKSFPIGMKPTRNSGSAAGAVTIMAPAARPNAGGAGTYVAYPPMFRPSSGTNVATTFYSTNAASANCHDATKGTDSGAAMALNQGDSGFFLQCVLTPGTAPGDLLQVHYMIDTGF
jgi:hypothetical protein